MACLERIRAVNLLSLLNWLGLITWFWIRPTVKDGLRWHHRHLRWAFTATQGIWSSTLLLMTSMSHMASNRIHYPFLDWLLMTTLITPSCHFVKWLLRILIGHLLLLIVVHFFSMGTRVMRLSVVVRVCAFCHQSFSRLTCYTLFVTVEIILLFLMSV